jgi:hypothetical protein
MMSMEQHIIKFSFTVDGATEKRYKLYTQVL